MKINTIGHLVKTNPIKPNFRNAEMNVNLFISKDYRKIDDFAVQKNKPNQSQFSTPKLRPFASVKKHAKKSKKCLTLIVI